MLRSEGVGIGGQALQLPGSRRIGPEVWRQGTAGFQRDLGALRQSAVMDISNHLVAVGLGRVHQPKNGTGVGCDEEGDGLGYSESPSMNPKLLAGLTTASHFKSSIEPRPMTKT